MILDNLSSDQRDIVRSTWMGRLKAIEEEIERTCTCKKDRIRRLRSTHSHLKGFYYARLMQLYRIARPVLQAP